MKSFYYLLVVVFCCLIIAKPLSAQISVDEFNAFKSQNINLTTSGLNALFPRVEQTYYKGYNNSPALSEVAYLDSVRDAYDLTEGEMEMLSNNHFFITQRIEKSSFAQALHDIYIKDLPVFVSTDIILDALHRSYDYLLKNLERDLMSQNIEDFLAELYQKLPVFIEKYNETGIDESLKDIDLYVTVAYSLITGEKKSLNIASEESYDQVLKAVDECKPVRVSLFCKEERHRDLDFSQFKVRGHYVYTEPDEMMGLKSLEPYFRAQMWLGRMEFFMTPTAGNPWEEPWGKDEIRRMNINAYLLNELWEESETRDKFDVNNRIINYLVGESDNVTPSELETFYPEQEITDVSFFLDDERYDEYIETLSTNDDFAQKILGGMLFSNPDNVADTLPVSYRLSGQRFIIDSYILANMVYDRIIYQNRSIFRGMPKALDALYALGNSDAAFFLQDEIEEFKYASNLANMRYLVDHKEPSFWQSNYYNGWLGAIRCLNPVEDADNQPFFMRTSAWHHQKMNTQLASWAQLRHDNVLYAKPSYTGMTGCSFPHSYVEPYPEFYAGIADFTSDLSEFLGNLQLADWEAVEAVSRLEGIVEIMNKLEQIAIKELSSANLSDDEKKWLKKMLFEDGMSGAPPYSGWYADLLLNPYDMIKPDYPIVDIHTQPTDESGAPVGKVLHAATGDVNIGTFIVKNVELGEYIAYSGPFFSYYDTITTGFERLTDQDWEKIINTGDEPSRPVWTNSFLLDDNGKKKSEIIELPNKMLVSITEYKDNSNKKVTVYPNPVSSQLHIKYEGEKVVSYSIVTSDGRVIRSNRLKGNSTIDFSAMKKGLYLLHLKGVNVNVVKKIIKQ
ncbi:MAG: DUF3160 domain-containing protein [Prolixibacteraceae bacterium]|jgi:hypothetical protein|nr:DUF3160 domain-containing protein [Prolixibacteraceae bacterium]